MSGERRTAGSRRQNTFAEAVLTRHRAALHRFLLRRLRDDENAQDLAQEVYLRLLRVEDAAMIRDPLAFLYRVAINVVYEFRLRQKRDPVTFDSETAEELAERAAGEAGTASEPEANRMLHVEHQLRRVLGTLPPMMRAVFILRKRDGMSNKEIARELGISEHTVKKYLCKAVAQCRLLAARERSART